MRVIGLNNQQNISFESKIRATSTFGFGVNRAIELGDKGFFNAIKFLTNDGFKREIVIGGSNSSTKKFVNAQVILRADNLEYSLSTSQNKKLGIDSFQLMGENVIELVKKLATETGNISKESLEAKSTKEILVKECNELYRTIFVG